MEWIQMIGVCLLTAVIYIILKPMNGSIAGILCAVFGVMLLGSMLPQIQQYVESVRGFLLSAGLDGSYYAAMLKAMGVIVIVQTAEQICCDMGVPMIAEQIAMCGRFAIWGIAIPLFIDLTQMVVGVLR